MRFLMAMAILPTVVLMMYIRRLDKIEKEPKELIIQLLIFGGLTTISAIILELIGGLLIGVVFEADSTIYTFLNCFFVIAAAEELGKLVVLRLRTWNDRNFNYTYDAIVYAVAASLGFATVENVLYVLFSDDGFSTAIMRALTAVPGHTIFGVFMGFHYSAAKRADAWGEKNKSLLEMGLAYLIPVLIHGFYDFTLMVGNWLMIVVFFVFYITVLIIAFRRVRKMSREDIPIGFYKDAGVQYAGTPGDYIGAGGAERMRQNALPPEPPKPASPPQQPNQYGYTPPPQNIYGYTRPQQPPQQPAPQQNAYGYAPPQSYQHPANPYGYTAPQPQTPPQPALFQDNFIRPAQPFSQVQPAYSANPDHPEMPPLEMPDIEP